MRVLALALALLVSSYGHAADDAPLASELTPRCYSAEERANIARAITGLDAENTALKARVNASVPVVLVVVVGVVAAGLGAAAGYGISRATAPKP